MTEARGRRRLGRGLEALLGPSVEEAQANGSLRTVRLADVQPNPYQPRRSFPEEALAELAESMRTSGLLQPVVVRPCQDGKFELIAGERRCRAAERLGWTEIDAVVRNADDRTMLAMALVENLQRDDLSPIDEARAYQRLMSEFHVSQGEVATLVGRARPTIANAVRLLGLPEDVQHLVHERRLTTGHAMALLQLPKAVDIRRLARLAVERGLSVRELEDAARREGGAPRAKARRARGARLDPELRRVEDALRRRLQTDVFVVTRGKGGRIMVSFYSNDDLERVLELILGEAYAP
ncbi:MAG TPA: ParB/RepB/Spo0J family partition protein [Gemmatimonadales bacterium]|nr:ParB/RepB/Spo0J family partition protein [Gemmatimonadales bacterium]